MFDNYIYTYTHTHTQCECKYQDSGVGVGSNFVASGVRAIKYVQTTTFLITPAQLTRISPNSRVNIIF